ncbi:magnesium ABC transporter ATPase [Pseudomonas oryzihabitans]|nr:magnesium ABC transporter ATPase [Pseudomonas psychrotolerans]KTT64648.1 magnesium ABC transporter ATPase [Pseudomonas psychrotolerans]
MLNKLFTQPLLAFFSQRLDRRLYRRPALWQHLPASQGHREPNADFSRRLHEAAGSSEGELLRRYRSSPLGLSAAEAAERRRLQGHNEVEQGQTLSAWRHLWLSYRNPFNLLLTLLALVSALTADLPGAVVIGTMVLVSTVLRFVQESRSNRAAERLKALVSTTATVLRPEASNPFGVEVPIRDLVPGDVVRLAAGDMIPADLRLLSTRDLFVSQAALTGESLPMEKRALTLTDSGSALEWENLCFMGTNVVSGAATAVVIGTGLDTYFGSLAQHVTRGGEEPNAFQQGVNKVSWLLIRFMLVMAPLVLLINGLTKGNWLDATLFALSVAVGLTPEMLPMIVTATLARGAVVLARQKVVVKRLDAIQNFGAMQVLCTDKTGTLTQDRILLERHTDARGQPNDAVLEYAYLNSHYQTGLKNLLDVAVLKSGELRGLSLTYRKVDELPFDFERRRMSVVVADGRRHLLVCKGALEELLAACSRVREDGADLPLTAERLAHIRALTAGFNDEGLRVVAVGIRELPGDNLDYSVADERDLVLIGYIAFLDPPKETAVGALRALAEQGVTVKVLTGDNERVTRRICQDVGLDVEGLLTGTEIESLDDTALSALLTSTTVFARLTPAHKERLVRLLRDQGLVVGFLGDGINDAPALRTADIGISVDSAVDIAKEAADIILLEKSLLVLEEGVRQGRKTFANMLKYIKITASSNFGNVFSVLVASAFLPFLPMLPLQLLVQNLLYDLAQTAVPFDHVDADLLARPQRWNVEGLGRFMLFFGPLSSLFDLLTFLLLWQVFDANTVAHQTLFQTGWFVEGLLSQTLVVHLIRTRRLPFVQSCAATPLLVMTGLIVAIGLLLPFSPLAGYFRLQPLPLGYFGYLVALLVGYALVVQSMKGWFIRRYGWQ